jgi:hypothetical protein
VFTDAGYDVEHGSQRDGVPEVDVEIHCTSEWDAGHRVHLWVVLLTNTEHPAGESASFAAGGPIDETAQGNGSRPGFPHESSTPWRERSR